MLDVLKKSTLFKGISSDNIKKFIEKTQAHTRTFPLGAMIFSASEVPSHLYILLEGSISINKTSYSGNSTMVASIERPGEMFGEVYAFLDNHSYSFYTVATSENTKVLFIPKTFFSQEQSLQIYNNLLKIFADKAFFLTERIKVLSAGSLRKKIALMILSEITIDETSKDKGYYIFKLSREELASYLGVARPSLSRELKNMVDENLIKIKGKKVNVLSISSLEEII